MNDLPTTAAEMAEYRDALAYELGAVNGLIKFAEDHPPLRDAILTRVAPAHQELYACQREAGAALGRRQ